MTRFHDPRCPEPETRRQPGPINRGALGTERAMPDTTGYEER